MGKYNKRFAWMVLPMLLASMTAASAQAPTLEYQVKASYLYNFVRFVTWPADVYTGAGKFNLCVTGAERFGSALDALAGERVDGHEIAVHRLEQGAQARNLRCHILFLAAGTEPADLGAGRGTLTIGETPGFLDRGGMINLIEARGRIRFEINQAATQNAGLVVSSRLMSLAYKP